MQISSVVNISANGGSHIRMGARCSVGQNFDLEMACFRGFWDKKWGQNGNFWKVMSYGSWPLVSLPLVLDFSFSVGF